MVAGGGVRLTDLNDLLRPAAECVLPLPALLPPGSVAAPMAPVRLPVRVGTDMGPTSPPTVPGAAATTLIAAPAPAAPSAPPAPVARVSLSDCLVCSGCVSSADAALLGGAGDTATARLLAAVADPATRVLVLLSAASLASIGAAAAAGAAAAPGSPLSPPLDDIPGRVAAALRAVGVDAVGHGGAAREVAAAAAAADFLRRRAAAVAAATAEEGGAAVAPVVVAPVVVASECPAVVLVATKRYGAGVVGALGGGRSIQAVGAALARAGIGPLGAAAAGGVGGGGGGGGDGNGGGGDSNGDGGGGGHLFVAAVAPCADKKLEAVAPQFGAPTSDGGTAADTDVVLTTVELVALLTSPPAAAAVDLSAAAAAAAADSALAAAPREPLVADLAAALAAHPPTPLDTPTPSPPTDGGSGGYLEHILRVAAATLLSVHLPPDYSFVYTPAGRSARGGGGAYFRETTVTAPDGRRLRFAYAHGYRHVQNVARRLARGGAAYDYVELMACGGGCLNGGGQLAGVGGGGEGGLDAVRAAYQAGSKASGPTPAGAQGRQGGAGAAASPPPPPPLAAPAPLVGAPAASGDGDGDGGEWEGSIMAAATAGLSLEAVGTFEQAAHDAPGLLQAAYKPLERERDPMFVTPAALSW